MIRYVVYGKPGCSPCQQVKMHLDQRMKQYLYIDITQMDEEEFQKFMARGHKTVPQVYLGEELIGGLKEVQEHLQKL